LNNILAHYSDGAWGWKEKAPYDAIIVTAAPQFLPEMLLEQLNDNGRLVIPLGIKGKQQLYVYQKNKEKITREVIEPVSFVPLLSGKSS